MIWEWTETHKLMPASFEVRVLANNVDDIIGIADLLNKVLIKFQSVPLLTAQMRILKCRLIRLQ